jgi:Spy/CpxP family protein refolding chaperone
MKMNQAFKVLSAALLLAFTVSTVSAQAPAAGEDRQRRNRDGAQNGDQQGGGRGNFDPAEFQKRMLERTKETLEITDDTEWKALEPLITKVGEARMAVGFGGRGGRGGRGGPGGQGGGFGGQPNPAAESLQKVIDAKASNAETKAALDKFVADRKAKQAELEKAQAALRKVLTPRQEAIATLNGLL